MSRRDLVLPTERFHGTKQGYIKHGCRDACCRAAWSSYVRRRQAARRGQPVPAHAPHGSVWTYKHWHCRCAPCSAAARAYEARRKRP